MVAEQTLNRYRTQIQRIGIQEAIRIANLPPQSWREIKEGLGITTNKKSSVLAQQRILRRVLDEIRREQPDPTMMAMAEGVWGQEVRRLREELERVRQELRETQRRLELTQQIIPLIIQINIAENLLGQTQTVINTTNLTADELQALFEELSERVQNLTQQVQQQQQAQQQQQQQQQGVQQGQHQTQQDQQANQQSIAALPPFIDRDLSYRRTARDGTVIFHFIRELTLQSEISKQDLVGYSRGFAAYIHADLNQSLTNKQYFKFYVNLVNENGIGVSATMSNGFIPVRPISVAEIQDLLIQAAEQLTSGENILVITFNTTSI